MAPVLAHQEFAEQFAGDFPDCLLTFGINPTFPSTGYGYIQRGEHAGTRQGVVLEGGCGKIAFAVGGHGIRVETAERQF